MSISRAELEKERRIRINREKETIKRVPDDAQFVPVTEVMSILRFHTSESQLREIEGALARTPNISKETIKEVAESVVNDVLRRLTHINPDFMTPNEQAEVTRAILDHLER